MNELFELMKSVTDASRAAYNAGYEAGYERGAKDALAKYENSKEEREAENAQEWLDAQDIKP